MMYSPISPILSTSASNFSVVSSERGSRLRTENGISDDTPEERMLAVQLIRTIYEGAGLHENSVGEDRLD